MEDFASLVVEVEEALDRTVAEKLSNIQPLK